MHRQGWKSFGLDWGVIIERMTWKRTAQFGLLMLRLLLLLIKMTTTTTTMMMLLILRMQVGRRIALEDLETMRAQADWQ